ncbi:MAG: serine/threonine protein kinase [Planctomycetia bacterium]|nr:serine/threonine protein kinase [Planctomycetia bacterium]
MILKPGSRPVPNSPDYQLVRKLGAGAFGEVWHARGPGGRDVALKFIRLDSRAHAATELRSLEVMRKIRHPNLVSLFGAWYEDGCLILAMELCDCTLADRLAEALARKLPGIPIDELLGYMRDAANGLDALVAQDVLHRDVKPANLLLLGPACVVGDFGLAKVLEHTASNTGAGTLGYIAPECYKGKLTEQSDQYSLAATYYHLRTGEHLYKGNQAEIMYAQLMSEPDLSRLPPAERTVLARALSKEPVKRWPNCKAFVNELAAAHQETVRQEAEAYRREQERRKREAERTKQKLQEEVAKLREADKQATRPGTGIPASGALVAKLREAEKQSNNPPKGPSPIPQNRESKGRKMNVAQRPETSGERPKPGPGRNDAPEDISFLDKMGVVAIVFLALALFANIVDGFKRPEDPLGAFLAILVLLGLAGRLVWRMLSDSKS